MEQGRRPGTFEALAVCALFSLVAVAILATYWRLDPRELYHVSGNGFEGGASRVLVFSGWPFGLVAVPVAWIAASRLTGPGPVAVATTILALEYDNSPDFVTGAVFLSTLLSPLTLTPLIAYLRG